MKKLRAHANVLDLAEERRLREAEPPILFVDPPPPPRSRFHPAAQALMAGIMQGMAEREKDEALLDAGRRLAEAAQKGQQAAPARRWRPRWLRAVLGLSKRARPS